MFDELLESLENTIKEARSTTASLSREVKESRLEHGREISNFFDPTHTLGKATSFSKSERFKELEKEEPKTIDSLFDTFVSVEQEIKGGRFAVSERFVDEKADELTVINPNYDVVKRNNKQAPKIVPSKDDMGKSRLSQATAASYSDEVGPGKYFIDEEQTTKTRKTPAFSKSKRFEKPKTEYEDTPLFINETQTKKRPPTTAVLKKKIEKNQKQISREKQDELRERVKFVYWKSVPLELDRLMKKNPGTFLLKEKYFDLKKMTGQERKCAILFLLDRLNFERGGFENKIDKDIGNGRTGVVYRKSTPKPFKFSEMEPGPDFYYPQDDLTRPAAVGFTFARQEDKAIKEYDNRDYEINEEYFKNGGNIMIMPEHKSHVLTEEEIRSLNRGPGFYDCLFSQVEKRNDIGVIKFQEITTENARENNCVDIKEVNDGVYFPTYDAIDPKIAAPLYKKPANVKPINTPEKDLFPEHWLFYDGDLNKVRAEIAKNVLIGNGLSFDEYKVFSSKFKAFKKYMNLRREEVEGLEYEPNFEAIEPHVEGFDMKKKPEKTLIEPIIKSEFDVDGDNLLLEPEKLKKKLPDFKFNKMSGRPENEMGPDDVLDGDVLLLEPKKPEKHIAEIDFKKIPAREEIVTEKNLDEEAGDGDRILINPKLPEKKLPNIDFSKQVARPGADINLEEIREQNEELIINPEKPRKITGFVDMERMTVRVIPQLRRNNREGEEERSKYGEKERRKEGSKKESVIRSRISRISKISKEMSKEEEQEENDSNY